MSHSRVHKPFITHPSFYFICAWSICTLLINIDLVERITQYKNYATLVYFGLISFNLLGVGLAYIIFADRVFDKRPPEIRYKFKGRNTLLFVWILGTIMEIIISEGVPLLWIVTGSGKTYEHFGVPSIHGFMNAIYLFLTLSAFILAMQNKSSRAKMEFILLILWSLIAVSRALLAIILLQTAIYLLISSRISRKRKISVVLAGLAAFLVVFGVLGDARADQFSILKSTGYRDIDPRLSGVIWAYTYIASPISNLSLNISIDSTQLKVIPTTFLLPLLPSAIQSSLGFETGFNSYSGYLAHDAFNVGTAFIQIFIDWGILGVALYDIALGFIGHAIWRVYKITGRADILSVFIACIILTIFSNQFNQLPILLLFSLSIIFTRVSPVSKNLSRGLRG